MEGLSGFHDQWHVIVSNGDIQSCLQGRLSNAVFLWLFLMCVIILSISIETNYT